MAERARRNRLQQRPVPSDQMVRVERPVYIPVAQLHRARNPGDPRIRVVFTSRIVPVSQLKRLNSKIFSKT